MTLNGKGEISGIPTAMGTFGFTVQVADSTFPQKAATQALSITIGAYTGQGFTVSGRVTLGGNPLPGVTLQGFEHDA